MADATAEFFDGLSRQGLVPLLERTSGSMRFDIDRGERTDRWRVDMKGGALTVSHDDRPADCVVRSSGDLFDDLVSGRANALASLLRNEVGVEGNLNLIVRFQRLFPAPTERRKVASGRAVGKRRG